MQNESLYRADAIGNFLEIATSSIACCITASL